MLWKLVGAALGSIVGLIVNRVLHPNASTAEKVIGLLLCAIAGLLITTFLH